MNSNMGGVFEHSFTGGEYLFQAQFRKRKMPVFV